MKTRSKFIITVTAVLLSSFAPIAAHAKTTIGGGPFTNLAPTGQIVHLSLSSYPAKNGLYILECVRPKHDARPTLCNSASQLWISTELGASFAPNADILFKPTATFTSYRTNVDCYKDNCAIFVRLDHTASYDLSEDQFVNLSFAPTPTSSVTKDTIYITINGKKIDNEENYRARYGDTLTVVATSRSGASVTLSSSTATCTITGNLVSVLKGTGTCLLTATSPGTTQFTGLTETISIKLAKALQNISIATNVKTGTSVTLPLVTKYGEKITYTASNTTNCALVTNVVSFRKVGACEIKANAKGSTDTYYDLWQTLSFKIR